jgi:hypothetical protein
MGKKLPVDAPQRTVLDVTYWQPHHLAIASQSAHTRHIHDGAIRIIFLVLASVQWVSSVEPWGQFAIDLLHDVSLTSVTLQRLDALTL